MTSKIGILGCGWLGLPLAMYLIENAYKVHGTTTSENKLSNLRDAGITPFLVRLGADIISGDIDSFLDGLDTIIINVPPVMRKNPKRRYLDEMKLLSNHIKRSGVSKVLFVSSTSVYGNTKGEIDEGIIPSPITESARQLLASEYLFMEEDEFQSSVVRFGGLIGVDRHPVMQLAGRGNLTNGEDPVNLIHLHDCIHMLSTIIEHSWWNDTFNGVYPEHPKKKDYYRDEAIKRSLQPPSYADNSGKAKSKIVLSTNFLKNGGQFYTPISS